MPETSMDTGFVSIGVVLTVATSVISLISITLICICCKRPSTEHKARVVKNVVAEEEMKSNTLSNKKPDERRPRTRPPSMVFDGTPMGTGRWDDLFEMAESEIPVKFRQKKPKPERPPNPPDVILHPSMMVALRRSESQNTGRPYSVIELRTPASPGPSRGLPVSTSLEQLIEQNSEVETSEKPTEKPETPLSRYPVFRNDELKEQTKNGSIVYYRPRKEGGIVGTKNVLRDRIRSDNPPDRQIKRLSKRRATPSDPGDLQGFPNLDRTSRGWDNVRQTAEQNDKPPPLPTRGYLVDESDSNIEVSQSDGSEESHFFHNGRSTPETVIFEEKPKVVEGQTPKNRHDLNENDQSVPLGSYPAQIVHSPTPQREHPSLRDSPNRNSPRWSPRYHPSYAHDNVFQGEDNVAFIQDTTPLQRTPSRDYRNIPLHPDAQRYRQENGGVRLRQFPSDPYAMLGERPRSHQRHRRVEYLINDDVPLSRYQPGAYLKPKPYYAPNGGPDYTKRYSDASDYSDFLYDRSPRYADRVNKNYDPYFFRSRWSNTPDSAGGEVFVKRRNSDFVVDDSYQDQQQLKQQWRRSLIEEEHYETDIVRDYPKPRPGGNNRSGHQSQSSRLDGTETRTRRILPTPPRVNVEFHAPEKTQPSKQEMPLPDVPFRYNLPNPRKSPSKETENPGPRKLQYSTQEEETQTTPTLEHPIIDHPPLVKQHSSEYGSLIDVLYRYRQHVRDSRQKEKPAESPESRLRFEREKLKAKLKKELEPRHRQSKNLEMVIETLLYLCESEKNTLSKGSWPRDHTEPLKSRSRPNSAILLPSVEDGDENRLSASYDVTSDKDTQGHSSNSQGHSPNLSKWRHPRHNYQEITLATGPVMSAPPDSVKKEFAFPSEEELNRRLQGSRVTPPPIPPRRNRDTEKGTSQDKPPPITPRKKGPPSPRSPVKDTEQTQSTDNQPAEPNNAKVNKRKERRRSLPSMHLTESEMKWLQQSGGNVEDVKSKKTKFDEDREGMFKSTRTRRGSERYVLSPGTKMAAFSPPREIKEESETTIFNLDDLKVDDKTDAQDIISEIERRMSENSSVETTPNHTTSRQSSRCNIKASYPSDSDLGTWSSVASGELPPIPRRGRLHRSEGKYPSSENSPTSSPTFRKITHTPPPCASRRGGREQSPPLPARKESLSPVRQFPVFQTPPSTPRPRVTSPLALSHKSSSTTNISSIGSNSPPLTPKVQRQRFVPKRQDHSRRPASPRGLHQKSTSTPVSPAIKTPLNRTPSKYLPKIPFNFKKLPDPTPKDRTALSVQSHRRRISRTGEIITLPDDDDYAIPFDCVTMGSPNRGVPYSKPHDGSISPMHFYHSQNAGFYPIREEGNSNNGSDYDDYAVPVNTQPSLLLKQRILSRSSENILKSYETAV